MICERLQFLFRQIRHLAMNKQHGGNMYLKNRRALKKKSEKY